MRFPIMESKKYFDVRLFDQDGQLVLVVPIAGEKYETVLMQAQRVMSQHEAATFEIRTLP
jgi:hypothetical protein